MVQQVQVARCVQRVVGLQQVLVDQHRLNKFVPVLGELDSALLLVDYKVPVFCFFIGANRQLWNQLIDPTVKLRAILGCARDNEWRSRFVDQNRVNLINNGEGQRALHLVVHAERHIVAQVVKAEFVVGAVNDVCRVSHTLFFLGLTSANHTNFKPQKVVELAHPGRVSRREIVVHGDQVNAIARECIEVSRQCSHQSLTFTRPHLSDIALVEHHTAN